MSRCAACGETTGITGIFERVTYQGAPAGGIPVHGHCLYGFFENLERQQWKRDVAEARPECFT